MTLRFDLLKITTLALVTLAGLSAAAPVSAQTPTPEQIETFRKLPPEQQQAILEQAKSRGIAVPAQGQVQADAPLDNPQVAVAKPAPPSLPTYPEAKDLKPFGYDIFSSVPTTFAPATDIPVPAEYVLGPGDSLEVLLIGEQGGRYTLTVGRDGAVNFPDLGPIIVAGMRFPEAKAALEKRVAEQMIGLRADVSMGALRSIRIFVLGEAERPGSYTVSGLSTMTNALLTSGGVRTVGSLRNIQLKRNGTTVTRLDLYDLLLNGDTSGDVRLLPGDVIFIPPVGMTVGIAGEVNRPAIYEVRDGTKVSDVLYLSGGLTPRADPRTARLSRIESHLNRTLLDVDLTTLKGRSLPVESGDIVRIQPIRDTLEGMVKLEGHVHRTRTEQFRTGMRLTDLVGSLDEIMPLADLRYALIRRENGSNRRVSVLSADLAAAFADPASPANIALQARDRVTVFDLATSRAGTVDPLVQDLGRQSGMGAPLPVVSISGRVKVGGQYPLEAGMTIVDLLRAGGGLDDAAYTGEAELARFEVVGGERRQTQLIPIDLRKLAAGDAAANLPLQSYDHFTIREVSEWGERQSVTLAGEVRFPGTYVIQRGETLRSVIERAGGLTDLAFVAGAVFTRADLREREQRQLQLLAERAERELSAAVMSQAQEVSTKQDAAAGSLAAAQALIANLKSTRAVGRLVIDLHQVMTAAPGAQFDLMAKAGDTLHVPRRTQEVTVMGEVQSASSHFYQPGRSRDDYLALAGGPTQRADTDRTFIVRADGSVVMGRTSMFSSGAVEIRAGDTVVVPLDAERMRPLSLWTSVTQIIYNIAIAVAAINSF